MTQAQPKRSQTNNTVRRSRATSQLNAEDWVKAATDVLASQGIDAVRVEPIATKLKVTKGSFYHHFPDRLSLHREMLDSWRRRATKGIIIRINNKSLSATDKLRELFDLPTLGPRSRHGANVELAVRLWAKRSKIAEQAVAEVDDQRLAYITSLYKDLGLDNHRSRARAYLFYASMMGQALFDTRDMEIDRTAIMERLLRE